MIPVSKKERYYRSKAANNNDQKIFLNYKFDKLNFF